MQLFQRGLLLVILLVLMFSPSILTWISSNPVAWYRPYIAWFFMMVLAYLAQRYSAKKAYHA